MSGSIAGNDVPDVDLNELERDVVEVQRLSEGVTNQSEVPEELKRESVWQILINKLEEENSPMHLELYPEEINVLLAAKKDVEGLLDAAAQSQEIQRNMATSSLVNRVVALEAAASLVLAEAGNQETPGLRLLSKLLRA